MQDNEMSKHTSEADEEQSLRQRAEAMLKLTASSVLAGRTPEETEQLFHELQVHQIELEMRNEELRRAQEALVESQTRYFDLYHLAPVGYLTVSEKGIIEEANLTTAVMLKVTRSEVVNQPLSRFILPEDQDIYYLCRHKLIETGTPQVCELRLLRSNNGNVSFWARLETAMVPESVNNGNPLFHVVISDITERKRVQDVQAARARLVEYSVNSSMHDFLTATLDEAEALTGSSIGFYHFLEADQQTLALQAWSTNTVNHMCSAEGEGQHYDVAEAGVWVDCIRRQRAVIHNNYRLLPHRKGLPAGHAPVERELVVPVFRDKQIVAILGVGNKAVDYTVEDEKVVSMLADLAWDIVERKRAEEQLKVSLQEKEVLLQELYHRTKNNMNVIISLLQLQATHIKDNELRLAFVEAQNRIRSMALVHQKLYQSKNLSNINLQEYISDLANFLLHSYKISANRIKIIEDLEPVPVVIDTAIPCGLILNELITNSLKHAFPGDRAGEIKISLHKNSDEKITLEVADNGVGLATDFDPQQAGTLGLRTIFRLTEYQLRGKVTYNTESGTAYRITFKDNLHQPRV
jgi:PAS domain S-box-containing protein